MTSFEAIAGLLEDNYSDDLTAWVRSPFKWIRQLSAKKKGAAIEAMVRCWCDLHGFPVKKSPGSESDCSVGGVFVEIKGSTLWDSGVYQFNQIRPQDYDLLMLVGISPNEVHLWCPPKGEALKHVKPQHGGALGRDTFFLKFMANDPPFWLQQFGGRPEKAVESLRREVAIFFPQLPFGT